MQAEASRRMPRPTLTSRTRPTPLIDPIEAFAQASDVDQRSLWLRPSSGDALVGIGAAQTLTGSGAARFDMVSSQWRALLAEADIDPRDGVGPRLFGGFSFDPSAGSTPTWNGFGDARLVLPERTITIRAGAAWLTTNGVHGQQQVGAEPRTRSAEPSLSPAEWQSLVRDVAEAIRANVSGLRKVVLARAEHGRPTRSIEDALRWLAAEYPTCSVFAIANREACFLGATPEHLISLRRGIATTTALAGTAPRGQTPADDERIAQQLAHDPKERTEHALVVDALRDGLTEVSSRVVADAQPRVHKLPNVQHLLTPIRAQLRPGRTVLDLVERLHPSPAVGGMPREAALEVIREREALDRGWYAAPMGWVDQNGEGDFVVGLRSALVRGDRATLFSGCGIVGGSHPAKEWAEWEWKLRPMRAALGIEGRSTGGIDARSTLSIDATPALGIDA